MADRKNVFFSKDYVVALAAVPTISTKTLQRIGIFLQRHRYSGAEFWQNPQLWHQAHLTAPQQAALHSFQQTYTPQSYREYLAERAITVIDDEDSRYPTLLRQCSDHPLVLFVKGQLPQLSLPLAVVGTRHISSYGRLVTEHFTRELVAARFSIISGGMYGVDLVAHQAALAAGGTTVAVLGFGFDHWYPRRLEPFVNTLIKEGLVVISEFAPDTHATKGTFPQRNRLMAGMSWGVLVTEAALNSGSHITAGFAAHYGREVFAVPGPFNHALSQGTKWLINQGATLVTSVSDIVAELEPQVSDHQTTVMGAKTALAHPLDLSLYPDDQQHLLTSLLKEVRGLAQSADTLADRLHRPVEEVIRGLSVLEIEAAVIKEGGIWRIHQA